MSQKVNLNAYFERIGFAGSIAPTLSTLELIHALHPAVIAFENLSPLMGDTVSLEQPDLERKLLADRRGGYCFEHNLLLMRMLQDLDYSVRPLLAQGLWTNPDNVKPSHLVLLVDISGQNYLADVGHGGLTLTTPLRLRAGAEQATPHETFRLVGGDPEWVLEVQIDEEWRPVYGFNLDPIDQDRIDAVNLAMATGPASPMVGELRVALSPSGRRIKLHNTRLTIQPVGGEKQQREIIGIDALQTVLKEEFGLSLSQDERLNRAFERILQAAAPPPPQGG
ncbi:arylamine N-acetyltransferase family protein [Devosia sp. SL43]|uniref:arylamine N-acetyltransferase family protein n=1 Tax=Devosia sp. SL43 TaxID=2806348 RepID=UPI001F015762|nr:arylamine N-acetyltransferase [Devosia sp. SL43]UJW84492.1 arylamine N-acetyltransferase [Devosia sp. SL43]